MSDGVRPLALVPYSAFGRMRLRAFVPLGAQITVQSDFEWLDGLWLHEGIGFTWFGRLMDRPEETAGLELLFEELDRRSIEEILQFLQLPLSPGMRVEQLRDVFGLPNTTVVFTSDRKTYDFRVGFGETYEVSCTVHDEQGLIHVSVIRSDIRRQLVVAAAEK